MFPRILCFFFSLLVSFINRYTENYSKLYDVLSMMSYFGLREWKFCNKNIDDLANLLKSHAKNHVQMRNQTTDSYRWQTGAQSINSNEIESIETVGTNLHGSIVTPSMHHRSLEFDMRTVNWKEYFFHYLPGIKKYFFKEPVNEKCAKHVRR